MNVVYASDNNFVDILGISMISLLENNKNSEIHIYILADNITTSNQKILEDVANKYHQDITIIPVDVDDFSKVKLNSLTWSKAAFSRMFLGTILEKYDIHKIIYLDCDTIVNNSLKELWKFDLNDKTIGMTIDPVCTAHKKNVGLKKGQPYYNSGVLLIDMDKWNENKCEDKLQDFAISANGRTPYVDQGLINGALNSYIRVLPLKFNVITVYFDYKYEELLHYRRPSGYFYTKEEVEESVKHPYIVHYTKSIFTERPWIVNSNHQMKDLWEKYKRISPWQSAKYGNPTVHGMKKRYVDISKKLPRKLSIAIQSFLHTVVKPYMDMHLVKE
jgi:lipopolysaccharide biosynthesis glycosyltransferase